MSGPVPVTEHPVDRLVAVVSFLKAQPRVEAIAGLRVYDEEIPDNIVGKMPKPVVVVSDSGGAHTYGGASQDFSDARVDVRCYAWSLASARELELETFNALRRLQRVVIGDVLLHWARPAGGVMTMRAQAIVWPGGAVDQSTHWPFAQRSWQILAADIPVP